MAAPGALPPLSRVSLRMIIRANVSEAPLESKEEEKEDFHSIKPGNQAGESKALPVGAA